MRRWERGLGRKTINGASWLSPKFISTKHSQIFAKFVSLFVFQKRKNRKCKNLVHSIVIFAKMVRKSGEIGEEDEENNMIYVFLEKSNKNISVFLDKTA